MPGLNTTTEGTGWDVGVPPASGGDGGGRTSEGGDLNLSSP